MIEEYREDRKETKKKEKNIGKAKGNTKGSDWLQQENNERSPKNEMKNQTSTENGKGNQRPVRHKNQGNARRMDGMANQS